MTMKTILSRLYQIEQDEDILIFYACESGSRAWGFPSADSDYDVRFLYVRRRDWYLSIDLEYKRDVIERPLVDNLDINGWDIRKALKLLRKSNPPLLEWLSSPTVYLQQGPLADRLRALVPEFYSPVACMHHYLHMARGNYREYVKGDVVWIKKYFYLLRPLLAIQWIERESGAPPMEFGVLVDRLITSPALKREIEVLLERKKAGDELDRAPKISIVSDFVESEMTRLETALVGRKVPTPPVEKLNTLFREALDEVEGR
jgi:predicted nucleotidyltransferase